MNHLNEARSSLAEGWRQSIASDLAAAAALLADPGRTLAFRIREVRSRLKRSPALLRLAPGRLRATAVDLSDTIRAVRRALGQARDAQAATEALEDVAGWLADEAAPAEQAEWIAWRARLTARAEAAAGAIEPGALENAAAALAEAARTMADLPLDGAAAADILAQFRHDYRRARRRRPRPGGRLDLVALHNFRNAVVAHRYQAELLAPDAERQRELQSLRRVLGKIQDLELLREGLRHDPALAKQPGAARLARLARQRQRKRAEAALRLASHLFAAPARRFPAKPLEMAAAG